MIEVLENLASAIETQAGLTNEIRVKLDELEVGAGGGGPTGPIYAIDVIYDNTTSGTEATNVQDSLDEIYALIGDINTTLNSLI